jgi:hypothetical protein
MIFVTVALFGSAIAQESTEAYITAQNLFEHGLRGSKKDNEKAAEQFRLLSEREQGNPLYLAYYGSTYTLKSRDAFFPWNKLKLGDQGLDLVDKALKMIATEHDRILLRGVPLSLETRLVAASTFLMVPDNHFHRFTAGKNLIFEVMKSPMFLTAIPQIQARFHFKAAFIAQKEHLPAEEIRHLKQTVELDPQGWDAQAARTRMKELGV